MNIRVKSMKKCRNQVCFAEEHWVMVNDGTN